jgi:hypothetical protein
LSWWLVLGSREETWDVRFIYLARDIGTPLREERLLDGVQAVHQLDGAHSCPEVIQLFRGDGVCYLFRGDGVCEHRAELKQSRFVRMGHPGDSTKVQQLQVVDEAVDQGGLTVKAFPLGLSPLMRRVGGSNFRILASVPEVRHHSKAWRPPILLGDPPPWLGADRPRRSRGVGLRSDSARNHRSNERPLPGRADDLDTPSQTDGSLSHRLQAEVSRKLRAGVETRAVIANLGDERLTR